ncbi:MAG: recombinase family protein [Candidatus Woesearchaeota archaeon]
MKQNKTAGVYMRVSTKDKQDIKTQDSLLADYCKKRGWKVFKKYIDKGISGAKESRPELNKLMDDARKRKFDVCLVYRYDRFGRSSKHLLTTLDEFKALGIDFVSYNENIDTTSAMGEFFFTIVSGFAQFERSIIAERVKDGVARAIKERGKWGRNKVKFNEHYAKAELDKGRSLRDVAKELGLNHQTLYNRLYENENKRKN